VKLGLIVEGHGEVVAVPVLVRRLAAELDLTTAFEIVPPFRLARGKLVKQSELERAVELMARKVGPGGPLLILLDADDDCPASLGTQLRGWAEAARADRSIAVVVAAREFEAWFIAAVGSLGGVCGIPSGLAAPPDPEAIRDAKGWLALRASSGYAPTADQVVLATRFDWTAARQLRSFDKLLRELRRLLTSTSHVA